MQFGGGSGKEQQRSDDIPENDCKAREAGRPIRGSVHEARAGHSPKSATVLGVTIAQPILIGVDEVIQ